MSTITVCTDVNCVHSLIIYYVITNL